MLGFTLELLDVAQHPIALDIPYYFNRISSQLSIRLSRPRSRQGP